MGELLTANPSAGWKMGEISSGASSGLPGWITSCSEFSKYLSPLGATASSFVFSDAPQLHLSTD
jgi:hypothetical protein